MLDYILIQKKVGYMRSMLIRYNFRSPIATTTHIKGENNIECAVVNIL